MVRQYRPKEHGVLQAWARMAAENTAGGVCALEVAFGPGYLALELAKLREYKITGLDNTKQIRTDLKPEGQAVWG